MRIGIVTDNYFPSVGGTEISIWNYASELQSQGHTVFIFCPSLGRSNPKRPTASTIRLPSLKRIYPDHPLMFIYPGIKKKFSQYKLDVLHSQTPISAPYIAEYISQQLHIPHVHTMHTLVPEQVKRWRAGLGRMSTLYIVQSVILRRFGQPHGYLLQDEKQTLAIKVRLSWIYLLRVIDLPDKLIVPSKHVKEILHARGFNKPIQLLPTFSTMVFSGQPRDQRAHDKQPLKIIYVGRLDIEKRPQILIDAVRLLPRHLNWQLIVVGTGTQTAKLKRLVKKYRLVGRVDFKGRLNQAAVARELELADIFVMPSYRFDTQGIVLLEACGAGLPIVYCDNNLSVGVERKNSLLTKPFAQSISEGITQLLENPKLRLKLSNGSLEVEKKYHPDKLTRKLLHVYKQTIADYRTG